MSRSELRGAAVKAAWDILVGVAARGETITYGRLAAQLAGPGYRPIAQAMPGLLNPIKDYCDERRLPRLNDLVVNQATGRPTYAPPGYDYAAVQRRVFAQDWRAVAAEAPDFAGH